VAIICVPTPLTADHKPDMRFVISAGKAIAQNLHPEMMVVLQSTCAPGTTTKLLQPELESVSGLTTGEDFLLVFAPERIDPGNTRFTVKNTPKLVGGTTERATELACLLYESIIDEVIPVSSPDVAEMAKLVENTFRFINISFVNEMALLCDRLGVNVFEVIEAAKSKPFAFMPHYPSAGVGGHCIPVVPLYLGAAARDHGMVTELIEASERINDSMPKMIVNKIEAALESRGKRLLGANVLLIGMTYKADIADVRESASIRVLEEALSRGARAGFHDALVPSLTVAGDTVKSVALTTEQLKAADAVILLTPHTTVDYDLIVREASLVIDTRSGLNPVKASNVLNVWVPGAVPSALSTIA
jgi:UDP-N-acetyl-D-glucosamine dehydrogenase